MGLDKTAGKEDPVELDSSLVLLGDAEGAELGGRGAILAYEKPPPLTSPGLYEINAIKVKRKFNRQLQMGSLAGAAQLREHNAIVQRCTHW